ncbi:MAG TPA: hypothetical protein VJ782_08765 [Aeromicrobium sp.]|nr:hypothetical protein [Aeromicrobium sp.]
MSIEHLIAVMIVVAFPPVNLFPILYGVGAPWWRSIEGQAIMIATTGLALLIDLALMARVADLSEPTMNVLRVAVFGVIILGAYWKLAALLRVQYLKRRQRA